MTKVWEHLLHCQWPMGRWDFQTPRGGTSAGAADCPPASWLPCSAAIAQSSARFLLSLLPVGGASVVINVVNVPPLILSPVPATTREKHTRQKERKMPHAYSSRHRTGNTFPIEAGTNPKTDT